MCLSFLLPKEVSNTTLLSEFWGRLIETQAYVNRLRFWRHSNSLALLSMRYKVRSTGVTLVIWSHLSDWCGLGTIFVKTNYLTICIFPKWHLDYLFEFFSSFAKISFRAFATLPHSRVWLLTDCHVYREIWCLTKMSSWVIGNMVLRYTKLKMSNVI